MMVGRPSGRRVTATSQTPPSIINRSSAISCMEKASLWPVSVELHPRIELLFDNVQFLSLAV
jgi:hypothetical protein